MKVVINCSYCLPWLFSKKKNCANAQREGWKTEKAKAVILGKIGKRMVYDEDKRWLGYRLMQNWNVIRMGILGGVLDSDFQGENEVMLSLKVLSSLL